MPYNIDNIPPSACQWLWEHAPDVMDALNDRANGGDRVLTESELEMLDGLTTTYGVLVEGQESERMLAIRESYEVFALAQKGLVEDYDAARRAELVEFIERLDGGLTDDMIAEINDGADPDDVLARVNAEIEAAEDAYIAENAPGLNIQTNEGKYLVLNYLEHGRIDEYHHLKESDPDVYDYFRGKR